ncbi:MAG: hypothetical protein IKI97_02575 [Clostridia bacterium]|nr:hypothetical protein [Clostridia bacterium]
MRLKTRTMRGAKPPKGRLAFLELILILTCAVFLGRLFHLQFASKNVYETGFSSENTTLSDIPTVRGEITDVNGTVLASNKYTDNITLDKKQLPKGSENNVILQLSDFFISNAIKYTDILPVSDKAPYILDGNFSEDSQKQKYVKSYAKYMGLSEETLTETASALYSTLLSRYNLIDSDFTDEQKRRIAGIRFTLDVNAYSSSLPCVLVENADSTVIGKISDSFHQFPGIEISHGIKRVYNIDRLASHILGRTGTIYAEDADYYREKGYNLTETVGKEGVEYAFEEYLRGINGQKKITVDDDGVTVLSEETVKEAKPGYTVALTIDAKMQTVAENALERVIKAQALAGKRSPKKYDGEDANAGAVVVMDPRDGAIRVAASYPTYSLNTFSEDINMLTKDLENRPLINRATGGIYEPGSTYKIATAAAALHYGVTDFNELIYDKGEYNFHETYKPHCWIYDREGTTHGYQNVVSAIQNSCNYYFFEVGKRLGIKNMNDYAKSLGLGVKTGIETGESSGILVSPEYMEANGLAWNPGYVLQAAIGQQHLFTPIQIASYISTFINGGKRYKAHLFDSARDYATGEIIESYTPELLSNVEIPAETVETIKQAMRRVVDDGTASSTFVGYKYPVGGKTGTAQVASGSDNVIFVGFAPYDNPEIVVTVILEHGELSRNAAQIAKEIFDVYFENRDGNNTDTDVSAESSSENAEETDTQPTLTQDGNPILGDIVE